MPGTSFAYTTLVLRPAAGDLHLKIRHQKSVVVTGTYDSGEGVQTRDVARRHRMWPRGAGWSSRPGVLDQGVEWDGFAESSNACTRFGYVCPSGEQTVFNPTDAWGPCNKILTFNEDLFFIFQNQIAYLDNGTGSFTGLYGNSGDLFMDAEIWGSSLRVAIQCSHTSTGIHFFVTVSTGGAPYVVINPTPASPAGTGATADTPQCQLLATVFWEYQGVAAYRLVAKSAPEQIKWMITPTGDPYDPLNWGPGVSIGPTTQAIQDLVASHDTVWVLKPDGCYAVRDATALAGGENLTPYWGQEIVIGGVSGFYWQDQLIAFRADRLEAIDVNSWQVQDRPRPIGIEFGRPNNTAINSLRYTALASDGQWLVAAQTSNDRTATVLYGTNRRRESPTAGVTEYDWFPEIGPITDGHINCLYVFTPNGGRPTLWIAYQTPTITGAALLAVDLFTGGSPIADPDHRYNTSASITFTDEHFAARSATKGALRGELAVRNCGSTRKVDFYAVAGAGSDFPVSPNASVTTDVEASTFNLPNVRGNVIRTKAVLTSTATVPVVIDEAGLKANLGFPLRRRGTWLVELSGETEGDLPDFETPSATEAALAALCESVEAFDVLDDEEETMTVVLENVLPWQREDVPTSDLNVQQKVRLLSVAWQEVGS